MNRVILIVASGLALAGCTSGGGMSVDWWPKFEPTPVQVQFQSQPAGAEAKTSVGATCQTPCALPMPPDKDFTVTFSLAGHQPQTISVQPTKGETTWETSLQPNPVEVTLAPAPKTPPRRTTRGSATPRPAAARPAAPRPAAPPPQSAPATAPAPTDPWPQVR